MLGQKFAFCCVNMLLGESIGRGEANMETDKEARSVALWVWLSPLVVVVGMEYTTLACCVDG